MPKVNSHTRSGKHVNAYKRTAPAVNPAVARLAKLQAKEDKRRRKLAAERAGQDTRHVLIRSLSAVAEFIGQQKLNASTKARNIWTNWRAKQATAGTCGACQGRGYILASVEDTFGASAKDDSGAFTERRAKRIPCQGCHGETYQERWERYNVEPDRTIDGPGFELHTFGGPDQDGHALISIDGDPTVHLIEGIGRMDDDLLQAAMLNSLQAAAGGPFKWQEPRTTAKPEQSSTDPFAQLLGGRRGR